MNDLLHLHQELNIHFFEFMSIDDLVQYSDNEYICEIIKKKYNHEEHFSTVFGYPKLYPYIKDALPTKSNWVSIYNIKYLHYLRAIKNKDI